MYVEQLKPHMEHTWSKVLHPTRQKIGRFTDVLPSQSLGSVQKRNQNPTKLTAQNQSNLN